MYISLPWNYFHITLKLGAVDTVGGKKEKSILMGGWGCFGSFVAAMNKKLLLDVVLHSAAISPPVKPTNPAFLILVKSYSIMKQLTGSILTDIEPVLLLHSLCDQSSFLGCAAPLHTDSGSGLQWLFSPHPPPLRASYLCPYLNASLSSQLIYSHHSNLQIIIGEWKGVYKVKCTSDPL